MSNKKAFGIHWHILILSFIISIGILMLYDATKSTVKVGEYSFGVSKALESTTIVPAIIERILKAVNDQSVPDLEEHEDFLKSLEEYDDCVGDEDRLTNPDCYCGRLEINRRRFAIEGDPPRIDCHVDEGYLKRKFKNIFLLKYNAEAKKEFGYLDFSGTSYRSHSVRKEDGGFVNKVITNDGLRIPINIGGEERGNFLLKPSFKFPVNYNFSDPTKEKCIFSARCASCVDVKDRYLGEDYKIKNKACDYYIGCTEAEDATDQINYIYAGEYYECYVNKDGVVDYLCSGDCNPPECDSADCKIESCDSYANCRDNTCDSSYFSCPADTDCLCSDSTNECKGTIKTEEACPDCWDSGWTEGACGGSAGGVSCDATQRIKTRIVMPSGCEGRAAAECSGCDSSCDPCDCLSPTTGCGVCGRDAYCDAVNEICPGSCAGSGEKYNENCVIVPELSC